MAVPHLHIVAHAIALALAVPAAPAAPAAQAPPSPAGDAPVRVVMLASPVHLDGHLDEPAWATADSLPGFTQRDPASGAPPTERTTVLVARDAEAFYVGVRCWDRQPAAIRDVQLRWDADFDGDDYVSLVIDGFQQAREGFVFSTNPRGAQWDAQLTSEDEDESWNGVWYVATSRDDQGWTAEFRIPFRVLRYTPGPAVTWGFNVRRMIRRLNEEDLWRSWGPSQGLFQLQNAGTLELGPLRGNRRLELRPYALGMLEPASYEETGALEDAASSEGKAGLDTKLALTPTLTADVTVNTDFAQVEVDDEVINLTRFPTYFPEKRAFFLESNGLFAFGGSSSAMLFYSRRIGLIDGQPVPILAGGRVYGRLGPWSIGVLDARTGDPENANDAVVRLKHDLFERSAVGVIATQRAGPGVDGSEQSAGIDGNFPLVVGDQNVVPSFWVAATKQSGVPGTPMAWRAVLDYPNDRWDNVATLTRIAADFDPALGFVNRAGILQTTGHFAFTPRPGRFGIRKLDFVAPGWDIYAAEHGSLSDTRDWQTAAFEVQPFGAEMESGDYMELMLQRDFDAPAGDFDIFGPVTVPAGRYWWDRARVFVMTSERRPWSLEVEGSTGGFYSGHSTQAELGGTLRAGGHLIVSVNLQGTDAHLPEGSFTAIEAAGRIEYAFSTRCDLMALVQHENEDHRLGVNARFHWSPRIGNDFYLVWNAGYTTLPESPNRFPSAAAMHHPTSGAVIAKYVHLFAL
jgi:hypothetical protein